MSYVKELEKDVEVNWFENHKAVLEGTGLLQRISWKDASTPAYAMEFILSNKSLIVTGDMGEAVFTFSSDITWEELNGFVTPYFFKKLTASSENRYEFNSEQAKIRLEEYFKEMYSLNDMAELTGLPKCMYKELVDAAEMSELLYDFEDAVDDIFDNYQIISTSHLENIMNSGKVFSSVIIGYIKGLKMALAQLGY